MKEIIKKAATTVIKVFVLYVFVMAAFLALVIGIEKPAFGVGFLVTAVFILMILEFGNKGGTRLDTNGIETGE